MRLLVTSGVEMPAPVPISTTCRAEIARATNRRSAPLPADSGTQPSSAAFSRAATRTSSSITYESLNAKLSALGADMRYLRVTGTVAASRLSPDPGRETGDQGLG